MINQVVILIISAFGFAGGVISLYLRLTLSDFILKTLKGRYISREVYEVRHNQLIEKMLELKISVDKLSHRAEEYPNAGD